ncbi:hypothetical protein PTD2_10123 [Pseudoalteromonas tunicata D2]|uniref:Peptidase S9 prolyl oligopeptidase catalytic domain-containing protein n=2 Tax=Pseudoalteromonas tunicata TaxID=314281 RepID=A4CEB7_9GAMM|nr:hypothetical protein PTD2_10123 [Pseudoalteromonas tunicata D2]
MNVVLILCTLTSPLSLAVEFKNLFNAMQYNDVQISPSGDYISMRINHQGKQALAITDRKTLKFVGLISLEGNSEVGPYIWANDERLVIEVVQKAAWLEYTESYGELLAVDYDGKNSNLIYGYRSGEDQTGTRLARKQQDFGWATIVDTLPDDKRHILILSTAMSDKEDRLGELRKINIYRGNQKDLGRAPAPNVKIVTDQEGEPKLAIGLSQENEKIVYFNVDGQWQKVNNSLFGSAFYPLTITNDNSGFYALDNLNQDLTGLFKYSFADGSYKAVFTDKKVDVSSVNLTHDGKNIYALRLDDGFPVYILLNKNIPEAKAFKDILATFTGNAVSVESQTKDGVLSIVKVSSDINPGEYYIYNKKKNELKGLFPNSLNIAKDQLAFTEPVNFKSGDFTVAGYFTKAKQQAQSKTIAPLVLLVHGGPHGVRDTWGFDPEVQFLALNGYSVLQVNYRGSSGYGQQFLSAGYKNWGSLIQTDLKNAVDWAVQQGLANANKVCIMGASFGAYSAVQSTVLYPDTYQCAIANAGIYDLALLYTKGDLQKRSNTYDYLSKVIGTDENILKQNSPVYAVDKIKVPLFLAHGERDERAPVEHINKLKEALNLHKKAYTSFLIEKEGHGFWNLDNQMSYLNEVKTFLDKNLL